ncbi:MAG: hypothetical protein AAGF13_10645 [Pseudomonadota bacterium]
MKIVDIVVKSLGYSGDGSEVVGDVQFAVANREGGTRTATIACRCKVSQRVRHDALLIGEAIHLLRRRPEIRSGEDRLEFARGLKPLSAGAKAA